MIGSPDPDAFSMALRPFHSWPAWMLLGVVAAAAQATPGLLDPATGTRFSAERTLPGQKAPRLQAVAIGSREAFRVDEYCLGLYVDLNALRMLAGKQREPKALADLLCTGKVAVGFPRRFLKGVGKRFRAKALQTSLAHFWPDRTFDPTTSTVKTLLAAVDEDLQRGDWVDFWCDGQGTLIYRVNEGPITRIKDPLLCQAFIGNYLRESETHDQLREFLLRELLRALEEGPKS